MTGHASTRRAAKKCVYCWRNTGFAKIGGKLIRARCWDSHSKERS